MERQRAARRTAERMTGESRFDGLADLARRQFEAGQAKEAHKTVAEALKAAEALTNEESRDQALSRIAGAQAGIPSSLPAGEKVLGTPARPIGQAKRIMVAETRLPELLQRVRALEQQLRRLTDKLGGGAGDDDEPA